jgi:hypothetical protein
VVQQAGGAPPAFNTSCPLQLMLPAAVPLCASARSMLLLPCLICNDMIRPPSHFPRSGHLHALEVTAYSLSILLHRLEHEVTSVFASIHLQRYIIYMLRVFCPNMYSCSFVRCITRWSLQSREASRHTYACANLARRPACNALMDPMCLRQLSPHQHKRVLLR